MSSHIIEFLSSKRVEQSLQGEWILDEHFARLAAYLWTYDAHLLELVHDLAGTIVADGVVALNHGCGSLLTIDHKLCYLGKEWIKALWIHATSACLCITTLCYYLWQIERMEVCLLLGYVVTDIADLWRIKECTLHTDRLVACKEEHIASAYELLGTWSVKHYS